MVHSRDALIPTEQDDEGVVVLQTARGPIDVDASIAPIVAALNAAGVETIASCSGHGHRPGNIALRDGRELIIARDYAEGRLIDGLFPVDASGVAVMWACKTCNSPRAVDPCPKCGTSLTKPADGWSWPGLPDIDRIRELAREVGYAVGVHGTMERDLDLIAAPWVAEAVGPLELAQHIAAGLGGEVVDYANQDKPCGRWSCNIHTPDWTKMIDLSVMTPTPTQAQDGYGAAPAAECTLKLETFTATGEWITPTQGNPND